MKSTAAEAVEDVPALPAWREAPEEGLRGYPGGTLFLLRLRSGAVHVCDLYGNMEGDISLKARRLTDGAIIRLERQKRSSYILLGRLPHTVAAY